LQTQSDAENGKAADGRPVVRLVVNADDFGRSDQVVAAVAQAYDEGILTSASLMVTAAAAEAAVKVARKRPGLGVGLHLVLARGTAASEPQAIPHLVTPDGHFASRVFGAGLRYGLSPAAKRELARELRAQFERFRATGLPLSHVDSHHHLHLHPAVFPLVMSLAQEFGARAVRVNIADDLGLSLRSDRRHLLRKLGWKLTFSLLAAHARRRAPRHSLPAACRVYGLLQSGNLTSRYLLTLLDRVRDLGLAPGRCGRDRPRPPVVEIFCHPSLRTESSDLGPNPGDLATLLDPRVRARVKELGLRLVNYHEAFHQDLDS
jgi:hopanoid biosynthesis associated protein HpnK